MRHEITTPHTHQHNGIAKRRNRIDLNMSRIMLKGRKMPNHLWGETVSIATYILNRNPTKRLEGVTPEATWLGAKPSVNHLRIFGLVCYRHVPDQLRRKLDDKCQAMVLLGYHSTRDYKLYVPKRKRIVIIMDVRFDETKCWNLEEDAESDADKTVLSEFGEEQLE